MVREEEPLVRIVTQVQEDPLTADVSIGEFVMRWLFHDVSLRAKQTNVSARHIVSQSLNGELFTVSIINSPLNKTNTTDGMCRASNSVNMGNVTGLYMSYEV